MIVCGVGLDRASFYERKRGFGECSNLVGVMPLSLKPKSKSPQNCGGVCFGS